MSLPTTFLSIFLSKGRAVKTFEGGRDNVPTNVNNTKTVYYMRKFMSESAFWGVRTGTNVRRPWVIFRYAEVLLNYAEALNKAQGPVADAYTAVNQVRARVGMPVYRRQPGAGAGRNAREPSYPDGQPRLLFLSLHRLQIKIRLVNSGANVVIARLEVV